MPREFVNDYIFNFPDTSFAWAFVLTLLAAALAARKRDRVVDPGPLHGRGGRYGTSSTWSGGTEPLLDDVGAVIGLSFHVAAIGFLVLARHEFWAKVRRGALFKATATLVVAMAIGTLIGWGLLELFPGSNGADRPLYALNRVSAFAGASADSFTGHPHVLVNTLLGLFGAVALMVTAIVLFQSQRADNALDGRGRVGDPRAAASCSASATRSATSHPPGQGGRVLADRARRRHLPGGLRVSPGQRRPDRRPGARGRRRSRRGCGEARDYALDARP